ncbi:ARM repeat-containing protein [Durotheca rogersii]|uniref:ARM repeat-containing protein n=1 Tax=Durotheca rogersii TaxID=419775 RepID=UPI002220B13F|nr:ARM repeat-containing protein [Durotheca rogersii]KAI5864670.1 ARM repeat-containing protein [Durotheca rogersii]
MTTATRPNYFPNHLAMGNPSSDRASQPLASSFVPPTWQPGGIWGNNAIISGSLNSRRDVAGSREPDEPPSSAISRSAHSQAAPWVSRGGIWNQPASAHPGPSSTGSASPTRTRDGFQNSFSEIPSNPNIFQLRAPGAPNGTISSNRTMPPGPSDSSMAPFKYTVGLGDAVGDDRGSSNLYGSNGNQPLDPDTSALYRRNSGDPTFLGLGHSRQSTLASRQADTETHAPAHRYGDSSHYPFNKLPGHPKPQAQRPSISGASVTLAPEPGRSNAFAFGAPDASSHDLEDSFSRVLALDDTSDNPGGGFSTNGHFNPANQPFQFNPVSQPWQHEQAGSNSRAFNQNVPESWADPVNASLYGSKRVAAAAERVSPTGPYRPGVNSPRAFSGTPNPRADPWSRPGSRDLRMHPDFERTQHGSQYLQQQPGFFPQSFYGTGIAPFSTSYEQYVQNPSYRSQVQVSGYGLPVNYVPSIPVPLRPSRDQDPGKGVRSVLLEEFRSNVKTNNKRYELKDIYSYIVEFSGDQHGSRFIQEKLQTANSDEKDQVFREIEPNALQLMKDVFGNYVIQKFFEHGNQVQKKIIAAQMKGKVTELSTQMYACRVVQKALEHVLVEQQIEIVEELKPEIMRIVKDLNGNHVIQKIIQMVPRLCIPFIMEAFQNQIESLASHSFGCRVIQRILEHGTETEKKILMTDLHACATRLITDQFGNYVTQHIIAQGEPEDRQRVIQLVLQKLLFYSKHKFASNVVEKSIQFGTAEDRKAIRSQITALHSDGTSPLQLMMKDQFGNYVIQKLMQHLEGPDRESLVEEMKPHFANLKKYSSGRQITALDRLMSASSTAPGGPTSGNLMNGMPVTSTGPTTPNLLVEVNSTADTPSLTMEQNSPESNSPSSTNAGVEDFVNEKNSKTSPLDQPYQTVDFNES